MLAWALAGLIGLGVVLLTGGGWVVAALAAGIWCLGLRVWLQRDDRAMHVTGSVPAAGQAIDAAAAPPWTHWVSGWYWQTDAQHRLITLRPGSDLPEWLHVDWSALEAELASMPALCSLWPVGGDAVARLRFHLSQQQGWVGALALPWPDALVGWHAAGGIPGLRSALLGAPRFAPDGACLGFHGVLVPQCDTSAPRQMGEAGEKMMQQLAQEELQLRQAEQEILRYALSHDLRAPLRVIDGFTRIVKEDYAHALDKVGSDHLDRVLAASARMNGMIDAVLAQAQLAAEPLARSPVNLSRLAQEVAGELAAVRTPDVPVVEWVMADGLVADADAGMVRRVLENLLGNAMKYSAKVDQPRIEFGVMPATNPPVFFVRDNGAGFDMQHADRLFGMFQRLHSAKEFPGTGVGLAGVQAIVRSHGGRIWAEARPGQGACFYFTLMDIAQAQRRNA